MGVDRWEDPRRVMARHGTRAKRRFSQNFLVSRHTVEAIVAALELDERSTVVELGAGLGTLTAALLRAGARVHAVERDPRMLEVLRIELQHSRLTLVSADAAQIGLERFATEACPTHVVGNLPYAITGSILRNTIRQRRLIRSAVVMVQREVRDRLVAEPGSREYGALTVFTRAAFQVSTVAHVPATAFHPRPRVASSVVELIPHATALAEEDATFRDIVRAAFQTRRKTLRNALRPLCVAPGRSDAAPDVASLDRVLDECGIDPKRRGETLSLTEFAALAQRFRESRDAT